ncbi:MAG: NUDIX domain-containing protein [Lactobacillaceae bacterium]|jgi:hypothetical protein|nr:NUDIX domain-containing protein [Lactobacillaceae bacterium]
MIKRVRAIIYNPETKHYYLIKRIKDNLEYSVFVGGGIENNETEVEAITREIQEEFGPDFKFSIQGLNSVIQDEAFYDVITTSALPQTIFGIEKIRENKHNQYLPIKVKELFGHNIKPESYLKGDFVK